MSLENFYYVSQIIASIAILISVLFLARQVRDSTTAILANSNKDASLGWSVWNFELSSHKDRVAFARAFDPAASLSDFTEEEHIVIFLLGRGLMQRFESEYFQFSAGLLNEEQWQAHRRWCASFLQYPVWREWWKTESRQILYTQSFLDDIKAAEVIPVTAGGIMRDLIPA